MIEHTLIERIHDLLPQTQCTKCGFTGCLPYAQAIGTGKADFNQCAPGGAAGIARLAALLGREPKPLNPVHGIESGRRVAAVIEEHCIGCTICIQACPVDAIIGAAKRMHSVAAELCTGCDLCVAPCPVDCIEMRDTMPDGTPVPAWTQTDADAARARFETRGQRLERDKFENDQRLAAKAIAKLAEFDAKVEKTPQDLRKRNTVAAALERARQRAREAQTGAAGLTSDNVDAHQTQS